MRTDNTSVWRRGNVVRSVYVLVCMMSGFAAGQVAVDPAAPPPPADVARAFDTIEAWVRGGGVDALAGPMPAVDAAEVVLRRRGEVVGVGVAAASDTAPGSEVLAAAATAAWAEASRVVPTQGDARDEERAAAFRAALTISVEVSGRLVPLDASAWYVDPSDPLRLPAPAIDAGLEGVAVRRAGVTAVVTPGRTLREGLSPRAALSVALAALGEDGPTAATATAASLAEAGVTVLRFRTAHVAQFAEGEPPRFLSRGGRTVALTDVNAPSAIAGLSARMVSHLAGRRWPGVEPLGLMGDYDPVSGLHEPLVADATEQALGAAALLRASRTAALDERARGLARTVGVEVLRELAEVVDQRESPASAGPVSAAATLWAASMLPAGGADAAVAAMRAACRETVLEAFDVAEGYSSAVPEGAMGLVALGLVCVDAPPATADAAIRSAFAAAGESRLVGQMPYLFFAEVGLAGRQRLEGDLASAAALRAMRAAVLERGMLRSGDLDARDADLLGGIVFTAGRSPLPSSQSLRPIAALAGMLREPTLTPPSTPEWATMTVRQLELTRFVAQLSAGDAEGHMYRDAAAALGGVRVSVWDQRMPTEATALALIGLCETLDAVSGIPGRAGAVPGAR